jgi:hypothetical protein
MLAEFVRWKRQASRYRLSLSEYVRTKMNNGKVRVVMAADPLLLSEYKRLGNLANQLIHAIHAGYPVDPARVVAVLDELHMLIRRDIERG